MRSAFHEMMHVQAVFESKGGARRNTEGIWILDKPIMVDTSEGKVGVYLMDTQGMFSSQTTMKECSQIFAIATLMSSHLIFNVMRQIQAKDLENVDFWTQYAKDLNLQSDDQTFQNLLFLIRDFDCCDYGFGIQAGERYLQEELKESDDKTATVNENIRNIRNVFSSVKAFAVPAPPNRCDFEDRLVHNQTNFTIGGYFVRQVKGLFEYLLESISPLTINGNPMSGERLYDYVLKCSANLLSDKVPELFPLSEPVFKFHLDKLVKQERAKYKKIIKKAMDTDECSVSDLYKYHNDQLLEALGRFDKVVKLSDNLILDYRRRLESDIADTYEVLSSYFTQKLEQKDSESRREEEAKIAKMREGQLSEMIKRQEEKIRETATKHARDAEEMKKRLEEQEKRFQEAEETRKKEVEEASRLLEENQRLHKEAEIFRKMEAAEAKARYEEQKQLMQRMADDNLKQAREARNNFQKMKERFKEEEELLKSDPKNTCPKSSNNQEMTKQCSRK
uniref:Uncharacterized protein LOC100175442 n=1 Tax=Phallusia mammillata TaxID=59560 RepID=A0A6F9DGS8_9ASCI|nr:uncharacterized protein LOC100175442 [Phallusia mammillata]